MDLTERAGEARIEDDGNVLVAPSSLHGDDLVRDFFGTVVTPEDLAAGALDLARKTVHLCGDISAVSRRRLKAADRVFLVRGRAHGYREDDLPEAWPSSAPAAFPAACTAPACTTRASSNPTPTTSDGSVRSTSSSP
nr:hypothetical protein [Streptomyces roseicoloratus]